MTAFGIIGLSPHDFADPYTAPDEDGGDAEYCGVRTPHGSPCGYPRSMHRVVTRELRDWEMSGPPDDDFLVFRDQGLSPKALTAIGLVLIAAAVVVYVVIGGRP
jgi:hypothetical protein